jgi:NADPH:quinone reductase-like Zn-dependent oxidoreductase
MATADQSLIDASISSVPATMQAAVYRGRNDVRLESVPVPEISAGELLVRVHTCGVCGTDLKKIATGSHSAPRIFGHETSGVVAAIGQGVDQFRSATESYFFTTSRAVTVTTADIRLSRSAKPTKRSARRRVLSLPEEGSPNTFE